MYCNEMMGNVIQHVRSFFAVCVEWWPPLMDLDTSTHWYTLLLKLHFTGGTWIWVFSQMHLNLILYIFLYNSVSEFAFSPEWWASGAIRSFSYLCLYFLCICICTCFWIWVFTEFSPEWCAIGAIKSFTQQWSRGFAPVVSSTKAQKGNLALCPTGRVSPGLCHHSYLYLCLYLFLLLYLCLFVNLYLYQKHKRRIWLCAQLGRFH